MGQANMPVRTKEDAMAARRRLAEDPVILVFRDRILKVYSESEIKVVLNEDGSVSSIEQSRQSEIDVLSEMLKQYTEAAHPTH